MPLRHHLRPDQHDPIGRAEPLHHLPYRAGPRRDVCVQPEALELGQALRELRLQPLRARAHARELDGPAVRATLRNLLGAAAMVAVERLVGVEREGHIAVGTAPRDAASATMDGRSDAAAVEQEDRAAAPLHDLPERAE